MFTAVLAPQVTDYILERPKWQQALLARLRSLILDIAPYMEERYSYKIPFYYYKGALCYLSHQKDHVYVAFTEGIHLTDDQHLFSPPDTKQIRKVRIYPDQSFPDQALRVLLQEALLYNEIKTQPHSRNRRR